MWTYDYRCIECDEISQFELPLGCLDEQVCPKCGSVARRVFQVFETPPKIGGGACSEKGFDGAGSCGQVDEMLGALAAI